MVPLRDALGPDDQAHFHRILGSRPDPAEGTRRRVRVDHIASTDIFLDDAAIQAFKALNQSDRERLLSDIVWHVTCYVEGSITRLPGGRSIGLESGFRMAQSVQNGRDVFCVGKKK